MKLKAITFLAILSFLVISCGSKTTNNQKTAPDESRLEITISYEKQPGYASNQYAVWIEDAEANLVKTLFVTGFTADGGYIERPKCTPTWTQKANPAEMTQEQVDAFSGATPESGNHTYTWDLTDESGTKLTSGQYVFIVEGTLNNDSQVVYEGCVNIGANEELDITPTAAFTSDDPKNKSMISAVTAKYIP